MKTILAISAAAMIAGLATHAAAQDETQVRTVTVSYADLDLSRAAGRQVLERRVGNAVSHVCSPRPSAIDLTQMHYFDKCRSQAMAAAQRELAQIYDGRALAQASIKVGPGKR